MNDDEAALFGQLEDVFAAVDEDEIDNFSDQKTWPTGRLIKELSKVTEHIKDRRQILSPRDQDTRDSHSRRNAIQVELKRRGVT